MTYKLEFLPSGDRLVYRVEDAVVTVVVIAVGKRERSTVYRSEKLR